MSYMRNQEEVLVVGALCVIVKLQTLQRVYPALFKP